MSDTISRSAARPRASRPAPAAGQSAHIRRFETVIRATGEDSGGAIAILEHALPAGILSMPRHSHAAAEAIVVTSGALQVEIAGSVRELRAGESAAIPPGVVHTCWVSPDADEPARFLAVLAPAGLERYYADVSAAVPADGRPIMDAVHAAGADHGVQVDLDSLLDLIERHGLQLS